MKKKSICKYILDLCMSVILLFLMAYQVTGEKLHEWLGIGMLVLIAAHIVLNVGWLRAVFRGRYTLPRVIGTGVNILLLISMLATMVCGILMNSYVFPLKIHGTLAAARVLHLAGSHWSFVLMSVHLGLHWSIIVGLTGQRLDFKKFRRIAVIMMRLFALAIAVYGGYLFLSSDIFTYMTFQTHFAFLDYERQPALVICDQFAMMGFWIFLSYYFMRIVQYFTRPHNREKARQGG